MQSNFIMGNDKKYNFNDLVDVIEFACAGNIRTASRS